MDIDLLIQVESLAPAQRALESLGYFVGTADMSFHAGRIRMTRLCKVDPVSHESMALDLLLVTAETAAACQGRRAVEWEGHTLKVVSPQGLILLKSFRRSGTDEDDIAHLRSIMDED